MLRNFTIIKISILLYCLFACEQPQVQNDDSKALTLDFSKAIEAYENIKFSEIIKEIKVIPLETKDSCLISEINILRYTDNKFFILDSQQGIIFIFDKTGKFLSKISHRGTGPEEYINLFSFDVDTATHSVCLFSAYRGLMYYDYQGNFLKQQDDMPCNTCMDFVLSDSKVIIYRGNTTDNLDAKKNYMLFIKDLLDSSSQNYISFDINKTGHILHTHDQIRAFEKNEQEILFFYPYFNNIYSIKNNNVFIKYKLYFGSNTLPENYFNNFDVPEKAYRDLYQGKKYVHAFNSCWENDKYFSIRANVKGTMRTCFYDKKENSLKIGYEKDSFGAFPLISEANNEYFVGFRSVEALHHEIEYANESNRQIDPQVQEIKNKNIDDNPVVFLYYFK